MNIAKLFDDPDDGKNIKDLWGRFKNAWNSLNFQSPLQFGCQLNTYIKEYEENSPLNCFLVDDKEKEGGMCMAAAMQQLAIMQSSLL